MTFFLRYILTYFLIFIIGTSSMAQDLLSNPLIDSLKNELALSKDSARVDLLNQIAYHFYYFNNDSTETYAMKSVALAKELNYLKGLSDAQRMMGIAFKARNEEGKAIKWLYEGLKTAQSINYYQGIADNLNSLGIFYNSIEDFDQALRYFKESLRFQRLAGNLLREGLLFTNIGTIYLVKNQLDSSLMSFQRSLNILENEGKENWIAMVYSQYGGYLIAVDRLSEAEDYTFKAIEISKRLGQTFHLRKSYQNLAEIYLLKNKYAESQKMTDLAIAYSKKIGFYSYLIEAYETQYNLKKAQQKYDLALYYLEIYSSLKDTLRQNQIITESNLLSFLTELDKKEQENMILREEKENQLAQNNANQAVIYRQTIIGIATTAILIVVTIIAVIFFKLRQKERDANKKLKDSNNELEEQKEELSATLHMLEHLNAQLQAQNKTLNHIAIVSLTDLEGNIISVNENFCNATGYSREELLGCNHNILTSGEHADEVFKTMWETISSGNTWRGELKNKKKNGEFYWVESAIAPIFDDNGSPKQFFSLQFEITKRKNYLNELTFKGLELEESNKLKDKLLSIVSHDFKGPLNSLRGTLTLFLKGAISKEELNMLIYNLVEKLDNTYNLLENLLQWAKSQMQGMKVYKKQIELKDICQSCIDLLSPIAEKKRVEIHSAINSSLPVFADNEMIKLVIRNLLANAIKFCSAGDHINIDYQIKNNKVIISIADNGIGISNENQHKLFKPENFSTNGTSNEKGMGLGLLLCKDFVEKNGGEIWFESELEKGSTFYFTLFQSEVSAPVPLS